MSRRVLTSRCRACFAWRATPEPWNSLSTPLSYDFTLQAVATPGWAGLNDERIPVLLDRGRPQVAIERVASVPRSRGGT